MGGARSQVNKPHKTRFASKASRHSHKIDEVRSGKPESSHRAAVQGARAARVQRSKAECQVRINQVAVTPLRRSARLHLDDKSSSYPLLEKESYQKQPLLTPNPREFAHNRKSRNAVSKVKIQENSTRSSQRNIPPRRKDADASCKKSDMQELKPSCCEELMRKRKRGTEGKLTSRKQSHQEIKSDCQEIAPMIEPKRTIRKKSEKDPSSMMQPKIGDDRLINTEEHNEELHGIARGVQQQLCGSDDWTEEQDLTLRQAYFTARPSPHFWKKVSKMVPGKSAKECFNRVHADLSTPTPIAPRPRTSKTNFSPLGHFTLSDPKFPNPLEPMIGRRRTTRQKSLAAQKTVRHLLKKHCLIDQAQEADHFSIFETSPSALQLNISPQDSPGTPDNYVNSCPLHKYSVSSSARKKPLSRLKTMQAEPSPAVLKPVKNAVLHEKYIDQLSRREGTKRPRKKVAGTKAADPGRPLSERQAGGLNAAKNALISEAADFICHFKKLQANSLAHVLEDSEDDEDDCI